MTKLIALTFMFSALIACGCARAEQKNQSEPAREKMALSCEPSEDPFACLRTQCSEAGGTFSESTKTCLCDSNKLFAIGSRGSCVFPQFDKDVVSFTVEREIPTELTVDITNENRSFLLKTLPYLSVPIAAEGRAATSLFASASDFLNTMKSLPRTMQLDFMNFYRPETYLYDESSNSAVTSRMINILRRTYFRPVETNAWAFFTEQPLSEASVMTSSNKGCAEVCIATYKLKEDGVYEATRTQLYSGGAIYDDHVTLNVASTGEMAYTLFLLGGRLSHFLKREKDDSVWLYDSSQKRVTEIQSPSTEDRPPRQRFLPRSVPVAIFEGYTDANIDRVAFYGPHLDSHYYGWFKVEDRTPFQLGRRLSRFAEESQPSAKHGRTVSELASRNFSNPLLPFFPEHLWNGDFARFVENFKESSDGKFVGSLSFAYPMTPEACAKSGITQVFKQTSELALWTVAAGNSGQRTDKGASLNCPQNMNTENVLVVAASGDGKRLTSTSAYGESYADLADLGCAQNESSCREAATSFAAPRAARRIADVLEAFPELEMNKIRFALLVTSRVPFRAEGTDSSRIQNTFLSVRSGGFIDEVAAKVFLSVYRGDNLEQALVQAKSAQYSGLKKQSTAALISHQIQRLKKLGVIQ